MKNSLRFVSTLLILILGVACTQNTSNQNEHDNTPSKAEDVIISVESSTMEAALLVENFRGESSQPLVDFFEKHLTLEFFTRLSQEKDPDDLRALRKFHLRFIFNFSQYPNEKRQLSQLALDYYQRLRTGCDGEFNRCQLIQYLAQSIYAGDVFSTAENLIGAQSKAQFVNFMTSIGRPYNNPHMIKRRVDQIVDEMEANQEASQTKLDEMTNHLIYLSSRNQDIGIRPLLVIKGILKNSPNDLRLRKSYERLLVLALNLGVSDEAAGLSDEHMVKLIENDSIVEVLNSQLNNELVRWDSLHSTFDTKKDSLIIYTLLGILKRSLNGPLHSYAFSKVMSEEKTKSRFLGLTNTYVYKSFVLNIYKSHEAIGSAFQKELAKSSGKVESIFTELYRVADNEIANVWMSTYRAHVLSIESSLARFYSTKELEKINRAASKLEINLRNLVGYPVLFIIGYYAIQQGNFDLTAYSRTGAIMHMDAQLYFHELFAGRMGQGLNAINADRGQAQDILQAFYTSLDIKVLGSYGLNLNFASSFASKYLQKDREFLDKKLLEMQAFSAKETVADQFRKRCENLHKKEYNFTYDLEFISGDNQFFFGQMSRREGTTVSSGTSRDFSGYIGFHNSPNIKTGLSNDLETIRIDIGPRLNQMRLLKQALHDQGLLSESKGIETIVKVLEERTNNFLKSTEQTYKETLDCSIAHNRIESKMRLHYLQTEIDFIKDTYEVLNILNKTSNYDLAQLRLMFPDQMKQGYLATLPPDGDLLEIANDRWLSMGQNIKNQIANYTKKMKGQLGFKKASSGQYEFFTNVFETRIRRLSFFNDETVSGKLFPHMNVSDVPENYEALDRMFSRYPTKFMSWNIDKSVKDASDLVFKIFEADYKPVSAMGTVVDLNSTFLWRTILLNLGNIMKVKNFLAFNKNYDYWNYNKAAKESFAKEFDYIRLKTKDLIDHWNITSEEEDVLVAMKNRNFLRVNEQGSTYTSYHGLNIFLYNNTVEKIDLGVYDVFFHVITAYQLGLRPQFRNEMFSTGYKLTNSPLDSNPIVNDWIPVEDQIDEVGKKGVGQHIDAKEITIRRDMIYYSKKNAEALSLWDENILLKVKPDALRVIRHDLFQPIMTDRILTDHFITWSKAVQDNAETQLSYKMDLDYKTPFHENPDALLESILVNFYGSRNDFNRITKNVFEKAAQEPQAKQGPQ